jgi:hypothetical protein
MADKRSPRDASEIIDVIENLTVRQWNRERLVPRLVNLLDVKNMVEIGVWKGDFSNLLLSECSGIEMYYMIDPWMHLEGWNKPLNVTDAQFNDEYELAMRQTAHSIERRHVLRGTTLEVIDKIPDDSLDMAYIDGDHTLRGVLIDLVNVYDKVKRPGVILGDDFARMMWQHGREFEPTMVCPTAIYFAEAKGDTFIVMPSGQFAIVKTPEDSTFQFSDPNRLLNDISVLGGFGGRKNGYLPENVAKVLTDKSS